MVSVVMGEDKVSQGGIQSEKRAGQSTQPILNEESKEEQAERKEERQQQGRK